MMLVKIQVFCHLHLQYKLFFSYFFLNDSFSAELTAERERERARERERERKARVIMSDKWEGF